MNGGRCVALLRWRTVSRVSPRMSAYSDGYEGKSGIDATPAGSEREPRREGRASRCRCLVARDPLLKEHKNAAHNSSSSRS